MKIEFNRDLSRLHDAIDGLVNCFNDNYLYEYKDYNLDLSRASEDAFLYIKEHINFEISYKDLFFGKETRAALAFTHSRNVSENLSIDNFADFLKNLSEEEIKLIILADLNSSESKLTYSELQIIAKDEIKTRDFLKGLNLPSSIKWEVTEFFSNVKEGMKEFIETVINYLPVYKRIFNKNKKNVENFENYIENGFKKEGENFFDKFVKDTLSFDAEEIIVGTLFFRSKHFICITVEEKLYVFIGMDYEETVRSLSGEDDIFIEIFKNLSDKTRFQILNLLKERELYSLEIAEKIGITMATVSYHMNHLLTTNLVKLEKVGQKGYYSLNKETMKKSIDFLNQNFNLVCKGG